jgi:hypothetical protein
MLVSSAFFVQTGPINHFYFLVVVMVVTVVVMMVIVFIRLGATSLMKSFSQLSVDCGHRLYRLSNMLSQCRLPFFGHCLPPFFKFFYMTFIVLYPMLQHNAQLLNIIHFFSK